jgi:hypothetical protein
MADDRDDTILPEREEHSAPNDITRLADIASAQAAEAADLLQLAGEAAVNAGDEHPGASPRQWELRAKATQRAVLGAAYALVETAYRAGYLAGIARAAGEVQS